MEESIATVVLIVCCTLFACTIAAVCVFRAVKLREIRARERPRKEETYRRFLGSLVPFMLQGRSHTLVDPDDQREREISLSGFVSDLVLRGSPKVLQAYVALRNAETNTFDLAIEQLVREIRSDLGEQVDPADKINLLQLILPNPTISGDLEEAPF